ncbi:MAG: hypothetical protein HYZ84_03620 [Candidatus Omnitrophica bacterium]|nr:hypothetical protein [Candidatus Omnitrophota bacterium]
MIFLIEYNRQKGQIVKFKAFKNSERNKAENRRLEIELDLNRRKVSHEVVLLEAATKNRLQRTHKRYFETLKKLSAA